MLVHEFDNLLARAGLDLLKLLDLLLQQQEVDFWLGIEGGTGLLAHLQQGLMQAEVGLVQVEGLHHACQLI